MTTFGRSVKQIPNLTSLEGPPVVFQIFNGSVRAMCLPDPPIAPWAARFWRQLSRQIWATRTLLLLVCGPVACEKPTAPPKPPAAASAPAAAKPDAPAAPAPTPPLPTAPIPPLLPPAAGYVGSEACSDCHAQKHKAWLADWHPRALSKVERDERGISPFVVGDFANAHFRGDSSEAWMHREPTGYFMRTLDDRSVLREFPVQWVIGGKRMQDAVTILPGGRWQILPVYYHVTGGGAWVDYNESKQGRVDPSHPFFWTNFRRNANHECLDCHTTGLHITYDRAARRFSTGFADAGIGCESCHGPGARHAQTKAPADIVHPGKLAKRDRRLAMGICAQCHGPRQPLFPILDAERRYRPGQRYEDLYQPLVVTNGSSRSGDFFPDGRPKTSSFEYQALVQSRCFLRGQAQCLDCHTAPHEEHVANELKPTRVPGQELDEGCRRCHAALFAPAQRARHSHHRSPAATSCVACHMPKVITGVLDEFADHAMDVPVPANTSRHGIPSACGVCHKDQSAEALQQSLLRMWPGAQVRQARRLRLADAIDEKNAASSEPALLAVLADEKEAPTLRAACALLLGQRFPQSASALVPLLSHPEPLVRARAVEALGYAKSRDQVDRIAPLLGDKSLMVRNTAALVLAMAGDLRAEPALRALARDPVASGLMHPHYVLGMLAARAGDLTAAATRLEQAVTLAPYFTDALLSLAEVYARRGQPELARERLEEVLLFDPQNPAARDRIGRLPH